MELVSLAIIELLDLALSMEAKLNILWNNAEGSPLPSKHLPVTWALNYRHNLSADYFGINITIS